MSVLTDDQVAAVALASLPEMGTVRLGKLLAAASPSRAFDMVRDADVAGLFAGDGRARNLRATWRDVALATHLREVRGHLERRGTRVALAGLDGYPIEDDLPDRPPVLLIEGDHHEALERPRVAVVGTRSATPHGLADANALGAELARAGVTVVSGMAIGIDAAAHEGALDAGGLAVGVIGTGLDRVYPRRHTVLHERVRRHGVLLTEYPFGTGPRQSHFPIRNRVIAMLADVVVVVEGTETGGTRSTAERALDYGRTLMAIPGSRRNAVAAGCNQLIADGAQPLLTNDQVLEALGMTPGSRRAGGVDGPRPDPDARSVLAALGGEPATVDEITSRTGLSPGGAAMAVAALVRGGLAERASGLVWPK